MSDRFKPIIKTVDMDQLVDLYEKMAEGLTYPPHEPFRVFLQTGNVSMVELKSVAAMKEPKGLIFRSSPDSVKFLYQSPLELGEPALPTEERRFKVPKGAEIPEGWEEV